MENRSHLIAAIAFILVLSAGAVGFYFWLAVDDGAHRTIVIDTPLAAGSVSTGSSVTFKGLTVGHIESVGFDPENANRIRIVFKVHDTVPLTRSSYAELTAQGITGLATLTLVTPEPKAAPLRGHPAHLPLRPGLLGRLKNRGEADLARVGDILDQVEALTGGQNARHISAILGQLTTATRQLTVAQKQLRPALAELPELTRQLHNTLASVNRLTRQAGRAAVTAQSAGQSGAQAMQRINTELLPHVDTLVEQMQDTARQMETLGQELSAKPQSVLTGPPARRPGPGEPGFDTAEPQTRP